MSNAASNDTAGIDELRDWCLAIVAFMKELKPATELFEQVEDVVVAAHARSDKRALRMLSRDISEWAAAMSLGNQHRLDEMLLTRFGRGLTSSLQVSRKEVKKILKRGAIASDREFRLLMAHVDDICADEAKKGEIEQANELLRRYETCG